MTPDTVALIQELEQRVSELSTALETVTEGRDNFRDTANSLNQELDDTKHSLRVATATIDRLRTHIQDGVEL